MGDNMDNELTPWQRYKQKLQDIKEAQGETRPWHLLDKSKYTEEQIAELRFNICKSCEFLTKTTNQCTKCGCLMHLKTKLIAASCPIGKWGPASEGELNDIPKP